MVFWRTLTSRGRLQQQFAARWRLKVLPKGQEDCVVSSNGYVVTYPAS